MSGRTLRITAVAASDACFEKTADPRLRCMRLLRAAPQFWQFMPESLLEATISNLNVNESLRITSPIMIVKYSHRRVKIRSRLHYS